ncbi:MAG TPA: response regulator transcription factor, partial [Gammaproteobacteria bacterium]|nr:response regulator transcription factor [Gammaproteobacteria bacterium]
VGPDVAFATMRSEQDGPVWNAAVEALAEVLQVARRPGDAAQRRMCWPAGLTTREVEVLRVLCRGLSRRQIARTLHISESTVRHHLEHIYDKIGVTTRTAAALFAMEQGLLP